MRLPALLLLVSMPLLAAAQAPGEINPGRISGALEPGPGEEVLTLLQAIEGALDNNLNIELARYEPRISQELLDQAMGAFDPGLSASARFDHEEVPTAGGLVSFAEGPLIVATASDEWTYSGGLDGILPFGASYSSQYSFTRTESNHPFSSLLPEYRARWVNQVTLPLLRDFLDNQASITVRRSRVSLESSNENFRAELTDLIRRVEILYWQLAAARARHAVASQSLRTAEELLQQTRVQYEVGVVSRVAVVQAEAGVAEREFQEINAANDLAEAHDLLLRATFAPSQSIYGNRKVVPERPGFTEYRVDLDVALQKAFSNRPELEVGRKAVEDAQLDLDLASNQVWPALDVIGRYQLDGLAGSNNDPNSTALAVLIPQGGRATHDDFFSSDGEHSWTIGAEFSIPIPNTLARAKATEKRIEVRRSRTRLRNIEQDVITEVRSAVRNLASSIESVQASNRRVSAQTETLNAEQERLRLGDSTPFQVLEFEEDLAEAEQQLIESLQSHREDIAGLERAQGTLLQRFDISIEEQLSR